MTRRPFVKRIAVPTAAAAVAAGLLTPAAFAGPVLTTIAVFTTPAGVSPVGTAPSSGLTRDAAGDFFGTTTAGGPAGYGTVYELPAGSAALTTVAAFNAGTGRPSHGNLALDPLGNLYGATVSSLFKVDATRTLSTLTSFNAAGGGALQPGPTLDAVGNLYLPTAGATTGDPGSVFKLPSGSPTPTPTPTTLVAFNSSSGSNPYGPVAVDAAGNLFGTTYAGGRFGDGTVFRLAAGSTVPTTLLAFASSNSVAGVTLDAAGDVYGTSKGSVFELSAGTYATIKSVSSTATIDAGVLVDAAGNVFGTTQNGGSAGDGSVFELPAAGTALVTLASFTVANGAFPVSGLTVDPAGNLYGTTSDGGPNFGGTVFELTGSGYVTAVPEPASIALAAAVAAATFGRRRRLASLGACVKRGFSPGRVGPTSG